MVGNHLDEYCKRDDQLYLAKKSNGKNFARKLSKSIEILGIVPQSVLYYIYFDNQTIKRGDFYEQDTNRNG